MVRVAPIGSVRRKNEEEHLYRGKVKSTTSVPLRANGQENSLIKKAMGRSNTNAARNRDIAREKKEARFLVQAMLTSYTYVILLITGYAFASLTTTDFGLFLCTTLVWAFVHTAGGAIFVMFNPEIRRHLPCMPKQPSGLESTITNVRVAPSTTNS
ncbi:hypothetical protein TELCIR_09905 [Teladorsagia circumcincta]|uniref:7TM GPCR serpentine receptor class x (Srx) domain-containing protein n=1 Tax=Teladorsagia circumcincta TaxID=45464 RepID=A0A2G9UDJ6_TELCI|nr:hypothetical protein TELCIR_09905 [Teladorsagia circumcincta]